MNSFWKTLLLGSLSLGLLPAQQTYRQYVASETIALSAAAASLTVQAPDPAVEANHASIHRQYWRRGWRGAASANHGRYVTVAGRMYRTQWSSVL